MGVFVFTVEEGQPVRTLFVYSILLCRYGACVTVKGRGRRLSQETGLFLNRFLSQHSSRRAPCMLMRMKINYPIVLPGCVNNAYRFKYYE